MLEAEVKRIIAEYKEIIEEAGSEHERRCAKENAFDQIMEVVEAYDK